jgi:tetratricopeptide (TPR) repeat protein
MFATAGRHREVVDISIATEAVARQRGDREGLVYALVAPTLALYSLGRWDEALGRVAEADSIDSSPHARSESLWAVGILGARGKIDEGQALLDRLGMMRDSEQPDVLAGFAAAEAMLMSAAGRHAQARAAAARGLEQSNVLSLAEPSMRVCAIESISAGIELGELDAVEEALGRVLEMKPGERFAVLDAEVDRLSARVAARRGDTETAEAGFRMAEASFAAQGNPFALATTQLEHAELLREQGRHEEAEPLADAARAGFEELEATAMLERLQSMAGTTRSLAD